MPLAPFDKRAPRRILLICPQRIGDVLLATPLARSVKQAWPDAELHFLVLKGTEGVLAGNPDIDRVLAFAHRAGWRGKLAQIRQLWRGYDLALSTIASDRARLYGWAGARFRAGFIADGEKGKSFLLDRWLPFDDRGTHTVAMGARLTELLGIDPVHEVVPPALSALQAKALHKRLGLHGKPYVVLHPSPKFAYKMWRREAWMELAIALAGQGMEVLLTGGPDADERAYAESVAGMSGARNLAGELSLAQTAELIAHARLFIGPDTAVTHIAAAVGTPTIALFGPSNPVKWGPWPKGWRQAASPWPWRGGGHQGNVRLIQGGGDCVPCLLEGCERHLDSTSRCLQEIPTDSVLLAAQAMLEQSSTATRRVHFIGEHGAQP